MNDDDDQTRIRKRIRELHELRQDGAIAADVTAVTLVAGELTTCCTFN